MAGVLPWSYSSLSAFETCARRFHITRILKAVKEPQTQATLWGNEVHKALELAVGGVTPLAPRFEAYRPIVDRLVMSPGEKRTEQKFGLTAAFKPTSFFAKDVWFRGVIDLNIMLRDKRSAVTLDYKTGKPKEDGDQLELFAATTFAMEPWVETVKTGYLWLAHNKTTSRVFTREEVPMIWQKFAPRIRKMEVAQEKDYWPPSPSGLCRSYCPVGKKMCEFCGE